MKNTILSMMIHVFKKLASFLLLLTFTEVSAVVLQNQKTIPLDTYEMVAHLPLEIKNKHTGAWHRLKINDKSSENWVLEFIDFRIDTLEIYIPNLDIKTYQKYITGDKLAFSSRPIYHKNLVFNLPKITNKPYYIYFQAKHKAPDDFVLRANLRTQNNFSEYGFSEYAFLLFFYGILFCLIIYNLFHFIFTRDFIHIYYVGYVLSLSLFSMSRIDGLGFQYLWSNTPSFNSFNFSFTLGLFILSSILFSAHFLKFKILHSTFYKVIISYAIVRIILSLTPIFGLHAMDLKLVDLVILASICILGKTDKVTKNYPTLFFLAGYFFMGLGFTVYTLQDYNVIPNYFIEYYALNFGVILETVLLSIALSEKTKAIILEKEKAKKALITQLQENEKLQMDIIQELKEKEALKNNINIELEKKVKERTTELEVKTQLLNQQKEKIELLASQIDIQYYSLKKETAKKEVSQVWNKHLSFEDFLKLYPNENACLTYLEKEKWANGFNCVKCNYTQYVRNQTTLNRKCNRCSHIESVTANTYYHGTHIPIQKAMYIAHCVIHGIDGLNISSFSKTIELRLNTTRAFIVKIKTKIA